MHKLGTPVRVLIYYQSSNEAEQIINVLRKGGYATRPLFVSDFEDFREALDGKNWDLILLEHNTKIKSILKSLCLIQKNEHDIPTIILTRDPAEKEVVQLMRAGAKDVIRQNCHRHLVCITERELDALEDRRLNRRSEATIRDLQRHNEELLTLSETAVAYVLDGIHIHVNENYLKIFNFSDYSEIQEVPILDLIKKSYLKKFKKFMQGLTKETSFINKSIKVDGVTRDGKTLPLKMEFTSINYEGEDCCQVTVTDRSESEEIKRLNEKSRLDGLTELYGHHHFMHILEGMLTWDVNDERKGFLIYLELDNYAPIKERMGITASDMVIRDIAQVLKNKVNKKHTLARFGDITFTVLTSTIDRNAVLELAHLLRKSVSEHICDAEGKSVALTASVGIAQITEVASDPHTLLTRAAGECNRAARDGGNRVFEYKTEKLVINDRFNEDDLFDVIKDALIDPERLKLVYQPVIKIQGGTEKIYSVFLRLYDMHGDLMPTDMVFRVVEEKHELATALDEWVVENSIRKLAEHASDSKIHLLIKLSEHAIKDENMVLFIARKLKEFNVVPERLAVQISETSAITRIKHARSFVMGLKQLHCTTLMEHFGSGINSFKLLEHIDVDYLKIDGSYIPDLARNPENQQTLEIILRKAKELNKTTLIPWVEDANSLAVLWRLGADFAQGNYIHEASEELNYDFSTTV